MILAAFLSYLGNIFAMAFSAIGVGIGQGLAGEGIVEGLERQPMGGEQSFRTFIIGLALTESGAILALVVVLMSLVNLKFPITFGCGIADLGAGLAIGLTAGVVGISSSLAVRNACLSISRQPLFGAKITTFMLLMQSIIEAPVIFAFIIALIIKTHVVHGFLGAEEGVKLFAAGIVMALGCLGPSIGQGIFVSSACKSVGLNKSAYNKIFPFSMLSAAVIETPVMFAFLVSFFLIYLEPKSLAIVTMVTAVSVAIAMGVGAIGTGVSNGYIASKACRVIADKPQHYTIVLRNSLVSFAIVESAAIYSFIIALLILFR
jgi:F-type H+-transporting ATPase subunit c